MRDKRTSLLFLIIFLLLLYHNTKLNLSKWTNLKRSKILLTIPKEEEVTKRYFYEIRGGENQLSNIIGGLKKRKFLENWFELTNSRLDYESFERTCSFRWKKEEAIPWFETTERTDYKKGILSAWDLNPAMEFSSVMLETQYQNGTYKHKGGDHWRVSIGGPSYIPVLKQDLRNGSYVFKFLPLIPGIYHLNISLEYTLCAGLKEPPSDWFIKGTVQGKEQKQGSLYRDVPFINKRLWSGNAVYFNVTSSEVSTTDQQKILEEACHVSQTKKCKLLWNGFGGWLNKTNWNILCPYSLEMHYKKTQRSGVLWIFGDSVSSQFYHQIKKNSICKDIFQRCMYTYNWLYSLENYNHTLKRYSRRNTSQEKILWDIEDFNVGRSINELRQVFLHPAMNKNSVLLLNYGLHFTESVNYTNFKTLINGVISLIQNEARCKVIWKTTSSLNRHKYSQPHRHATRFMTSPRVILYNAYATKTFCNAGYDVIDIYPLTDSYPEGTGTEISPHDPVHYEYHVMKPMEELLERVFKII